MQELDHDTTDDNECLNAAPKTESCQLANPQTHAITTQKQVCSSANKMTIVVLLCVLCL